MGPRARGGIDTAFLNQIKDDLLQGGTRPSRFGGKTAALRVIGLKDVLRSIESPGYKESSKIDR